MAATTQPFVGGRRRAWTLRGRRPARLADGLERAVRASREPHATWTSAVPVQRAEVRATRGLMLELAARLRDADDVPPAALRVVDRLLTDGNGPLFAPAPPGTLHDRVLEAILALDHAGPDTP